MALPFKFALPPFSTRASVYSTLLTCTSFSRFLFLCEKKHCQDLIVHSSTEAEQGPEQSCKQCNVNEEETRPWQDFKTNCTRLSVGVLHADLHQSDNLATAGNWALCSNKLDLTSYSSTVYPLPSHIKMSGALMKNFFFWAPPKPSTWLHTKMLTQVHIHTPI